MNASRVFIVIHVLTLPTQRKWGGREILEPAGQGGRPPLALTRGAASVCTQEEARINVVDRKVWTHTLKS